MLAHETPEQLRDIYGEETGNLLDTRCGTLAMLKTGTVVLERDLPASRKITRESDPLIYPPAHGASPFNVFVRLPGTLPLARSEVKSFDGVIWIDAFVAAPVRTPANTKLAGKGKGAVLPAPHSAPSCPATPVPALVPVDKPPEAKSVARPEAALSPPDAPIDDPPSVI